MRRAVTALLLPATVLLIGSAQADSVPRNSQMIAKAARAQFIAPAEWDGIWATSDSVYFCDGTPLGPATVDADTICGGRDYSPSDPSLNLTCTGTADATTIDVTCTGSQPNLDNPNCTDDYTVVTHGTRSGDNYFIVTTVDIKHSGAGPGCDLLVPGCLQINSHGTRTGPAPLDYCATPTRKTTWGQIKMLYR